MALVGLFYLGWIRHLTGKVDHYSHLLWFVVLVTVFPAADKLSLSSWLGRRRGDGPVRREPRQYATPLLAGMVLIALVYFFPGWAKLTTSGLEWAWSDNLRNVMYRLWWEQGRIPELRLDHFPLVFRTAALGALAFELLFLPAVLIRKARPFFVVAGVMFHLGTALVLNIRFTSLLMLYVVFVDWRWIARKLGLRASDEPTSAGRLALDVPTAVVLGLVAAVAIFGATQRQDAWPAAAYPGFSGIERPVVHEVELVAMDHSYVVLADSGLAKIFGSHHVQPMAAFAILRGQSDAHALVAFLELARAHEPEVEFCALRRAATHPYPAMGL